MVESLKASIRQDQMPAAKPAPAPAQPEATILDGGCKLYSLPAIVRDGATAA
jgi:hypothetical protein